MYAIMNRDMDAYSLKGFDCVRYYEEKRKYHIDEKYNSYGDVLVRMKNVKSGIEINFKINWRGYVYWKPALKFKHEFRFNFLIFSIDAKMRYRDIPHYVESDHLGETGLVKSLTPNGRKSIK